LSTTESPIERIQVYDILGKQVMDVAVESALTNYSLPISGLQTGAYFVRVNNLKAQKLIVQ
ncbi:MAG: T9SS type A sorting domain-containing protein, partial [Bacteroidetes bacterium]|nr:T9SS type A sorting domain-containing protein [Bacteroidota bacterium]